MHSLKLVQDGFSSSWHECVLHNICALLLGGNHQWHFLNPKQVQVNYALVNVARKIMQIKVNASMKSIPFADPL